MKCMVFIRSIFFNIDNFLGQQIFMNENCYREKGNSILHDRQRQRLVEF